MASSNSLRPAIVTIATVAALALSCRRATCVDYHDPACWVAPPGDAGAVGEDSEADSLGSSDDGAASDGISGE